jgi:hypothetical protein
MELTGLADLEHENFVEALARMGANVDGALVQRGDGVALIATGLPVRLFNEVLVESDGAKPEAIAAAVTATRARGDRFIVNLRGGRDDRFVPLITQLGLVPVSEEPWMPGMALFPLSTDGHPVAVAGHEIRAVTEAAGLQDHVRTAAVGFEMPEDWLRQVMGTFVLDDPDITVYVGYTDGEPVTTGLGLRTGRTIGVYNISTVESARKRGYGAAMTTRIAVDGAAAGCDVAILQASEMGQPIYERLGYRTVVPYMGYVDPASMERAAG